MIFVSSVLLFRTDTSLVPETCFEKYILLTNYSIEANIVVNRIMTFIVVLLVSILGNALYLHFRRNVHINGHNYSIHIKYGISLTQQELLDLIIESYKLSTYKIKVTYKLYIICKKKDNFSLNRIVETL